MARSDSPAPSPEPAPEPARVPAPEPPRSRRSTALGNALLIAGVLVTASLLTGVMVATASQATTSQATTSQATTARAGTTAQEPASDAANSDAATSDATEAMALDPEICAACHGEQTDHFSGPHAPGGAAALSCAGCHGDATAHIEAGGGLGNIFAFGDGHLASAQADVCLECHGDQHPRFPASAHAAVGMDCASCHSIHSPSPEHPALLAPVSALQRSMDRIDLASQTCQECHGAVFTQFELTERHRLQEGVMTCQSCHDPHAPAERGRLGGFQQEACIDCHVDKGGPFVFEHGSILVEGCVACHTPHGSPNRFMLKTQRVAELCYSCHAAVPGFHARFTLDTNCTNCHSTIHGSNLHDAFLE